MKTQVEKLKFVMEAAGECYHEFSPMQPWFTHEDLNTAICKCGRKEDIGVPDSEFNPSPTDMNKLMELAEKLSLQISLYSTEEDNKIPRIRYNVDIFSFIDSDIESHHSSNTAQEALLNALFVAKGGLEDE